MPPALHWGSESNCVLNTLYLVVILHGLIDTGENVVAQMLEVLHSQSVGMAKQIV